MNPCWCEPRQNRPWRRAACVASNFDWQESSRIVTLRRSGYFLIVIFPSLIRIFSPPLSTTSPPLVLTVHGAEP